MRQDYYWTIMEVDCAAHVRKCHQCQVHGDLKHMPPMMLHTMTSPWPFSTWGMDIIGKIHPTTSNSHEFILVAIDYFTKWVETASYKVLNSKKVAQFIQNNIICRYRVPHEIISDNELQFRGETEKFLQEFNIQHHRSSLYRPQTNGAVEVANKNIGWILKTSTKNYKDQHLQMPYALWGYRTSIQSSTKATPYSLMYGMEAVLPIEMGITRTGILQLPYALQGYRTSIRSSTRATPYSLMYGMEVVLPIEMVIRSLRTMLESDVPKVDWLQSQYDQLCMMDDKRLKALYHI